MRLAFWKRRNQDFDAEIQSHLDMAMRDRMERGETADQAHHEAHREFGNVLLIKDVTRDIWGWTAFERFRQDLSYAMRTLRKNSGFSAVAVLSLALGIGANAAIFTLTDQILLRMLPVKEPRRLVMFSWAGEFIGGTSRGWQDTFAYPMFADLHDSNPGAFTGIAARRQDLVDVGDRGSSERAVAELVSGDYFDVLGVPAAMGRTLTPRDDKIKDAEPYTVLSYDYWKRKFGSDPKVLDRVLDINGHPMTVVGVAQAGFHGFDAMRPSDLFVPMMMKTIVTPTWDDMRRRDSIWLQIFARLGPGTDRKMAQSAIAIPYHNALRKDLIVLPRNAKFSARYLNNRLNVASSTHGLGHQDFAQPLYILLAMVGTLLLIACVNIASLLITRSAGRQKEIAIRLSLGATRGSLVRLIMVESLCIALAGGVLGFLLSGWLASLLVRMLPLEHIDVAIQTTPDWHIVGFTAGLSLLTAMIFGLFPALQASRPNVAPTLKSESATLSLGVGQTRLRRLLVAAQVALSMLLLVGAGLFARSLYQLLTVDTGIETSHLLAFSINPSLHKYTPERSRHFFVDLQDNLEHLPGAVFASAASVRILAGDAWQNTVHVDGHRFTQGEDMNSGFNGVLPGFFSTMGVALLMGRDFNDRDVAGAPPVVIVNETFVRRYFANGNPLGRHIGWGDTGPMPMEIVGVVRDLKGVDLREEAKPWTFTPALQDDTPSQMTFYVRSKQDPRTLARAAQRTANRLDASLPVYDVKTVEMQIAETHFLDRLFAMLSAAFAMLATILASIGLYGVTAYNVARRTQEMGIRVALGAHRTHILRLVMREVLLLTVIGIGIGAPFAIALARLIQSDLYGMKADDPIVMIGATVVITAVSALAGYVPARRASRIDPMRALRYE